MDSGPEQLNSNNEEGESRNNISHVRNVFQPIWFRCNTVDSNRINRFLIRCQFDFILPLGIIFWILFFITKN